MAEFYNCDYRSDGRSYDETRQIKIRYREKEIIINPQNSGMNTEIIERTVPYSLDSISNSNQSEVVQLTHGLTVIKTEITPSYDPNTTKCTNFALMDQKSSDKFLNINTVEKIDTFNITKLKNSAMRILDQILIREVDQYKLNVTILQYDNKQSILLSCMMNCIIITLILKGIPIKDCSFGVSMVKINSDFFSKGNYDLLYDPTKKEEMLGPTLTIDYNQHRKTLNYCELQGNLHYKKFNSMLSDAQRFSQRMNQAVIRSLRSLVPQIKKKNENDSESN